MRDSVHRTGKYSAKLSGDVSKERLDSYGKAQKSGFLMASDSQVQAEIYIKSLGLPALWQNYYMIFAKEILSVKSRHSGQTAQDEVCICYAKWNGRGLDSTALDDIVAHYGFSSCAAPAPPACAWSWKRKLTFSGNVSATNLDDFPVLVHLTSVNFDFTKAQNNGEDIRFMDSDTCPTDGTPLKHEIERWDKAGLQAWVWVKVPRIDGGSAADFIYMFYGNAAAPDGQDATNVWNSNYKIVSHMADNPDNASIWDSTQYVNHGAKAAANQPIQAASKIDYGQQFSGLPENIKIPHDVDYSTTGDFAVEFWTNFTQQVAWSSFAVKWSGVGFRQWLIQLAGSSDANSRKLVWFVGSSCQAVSSYIYTTGTLNDATWYHIVCNIVGTTMRVYFNGVADATTKVFSGTRAHCNAPITIGMNDDGDQQPLIGFIDEFRRYNGDMTTDWIMASYRSGNETLLTFGAEESA